MTTAPIVTAIWTRPKRLVDVSELPTLEDASAAIAILERLRVDEPDNSDVSAKLEAIYRARARWADVVLVLLERAERQPQRDGQLRALWEVASIYEHKLDDRDAALIVIQAAFDRDVSNDHTACELARLVTATRCWPAILAQYREQALERERAGRDDAAALWLRIGRWHAELCDSKQSGGATTLATIEQTYATTGDWRAAVGSLSELIATCDSSERVDVYTRIGELRSSHGDPNGGEAALLRALAIHRTHVRALEALVEIYASREDWLEALHALSMAEQHAGTMAARVRYLRRAAGIAHDQLGQRDVTRELYTRLLAFEPDDLDVALRLARLLYEDEAWQPLMPLLERLIARPGASEVELGELHVRVARTAIGLGDRARARRGFEAALRLDADHIAALLGHADLVFDERDWAGAAASYRRLLDRRDALGRQETIHVYCRLGVARLHLGDRTEALALFGQALALDPTDDDALQGVISVKEQAGEWPAVIAARRARLAEGTTADQVEVLGEIAAIYHQQLRDPARAIATYRDALVLAPTHRGMLQKLQDLYAETQQWREVVDTIERFASIERDPLRRGMYHHAAGTICRDALELPDAAIAHYARALDAFFEQPAAMTGAALTRALKSFAAIDKLVTSASDWEAQQRSYSAMLDRLDRPDAGTPALRALRLALLDKLAEIYRARLECFPAAIATLERAVVIEPEGLERIAVLAELHVVAGPDHADKAAAHHLVLLTADPTRTASYAALREIYTNTRQHDKLWCLCRAMAFVDRAGHDELEIYDRFMPRGIPRAMVALNDASWRALGHDDEAGAAGKTLAAHADEIAMQTACSHRSLGLRRKHRRDLESDRLAVSELVRYASGVLGGPVPELFITQSSDGPAIELPNLVDKGIRCPSVLVRPRLLSGKLEREVVWCFARRLVYMRREYYVKLVAPERIAGDRELTRWSQAVDTRSYRAAFVLCDDLPLAARMIASDLVLPSSQPPRAILEALVAFSISEPYSAIRAQLGIAVR